MQRVSGFFLFRVHLLALVLFKKGQRSHHPSGEAGWGWKGSQGTRAERTLRINEANLSENQNGGGIPGRGGAFYMSHQNATKASSPSGEARQVTLGQGVCARVCMCVCMSSVFHCSLFTASDSLCSSPPQVILSTAVRPPTNVR